VNTIDFNALFERFNQYKVLIIGDVMIDSYMWGKVDRISPEAPVPIIASTSQENRLGGAANVALNIQALGATPVLCSVIGNDPKAEVFMSLMEDQQLTTKGILKSDERPTTVKTRIISDNQHLLRVDEETDKPIPQALIDDFCQHLTSLMQEERFDAIVFEDYDKGAITPEIINHVVDLAKQMEIPTLVDPKKRNFNAYHGVTLFKPNFKELVEGLKIDIQKHDFDAIQRASKRLQELLKTKFVLITLSELGVFISHNGQYHTIPAQIRDIADVSGAGDTLISTASLCMAAGLSAELIAWISNLAGGLVCEKVGVVPINKKRLLEESLKKFPEYAQAIN
jgi:rfaE bifunctional protein kinase chain/domain